MRSDSDLLFVQGMPYSVDPLTATLRCHTAYYADLWPERTFWMAAWFARASSVHNSS